MDTPGWYVVGERLCLRLPGVRTKEQAKEVAYKYANSREELFVVWLDNKNRVPFGEGAFRPKRVR